MGAVAIREDFQEGVMSELAFQEFNRLRARQPAVCCVYGRACSARPLIRCLWDVALLESSPLMAAEAGLEMADPEG